MALLIEDLKENKLYRKELYLPSNPKNKRKGSVIFMMTPDYKSSVKSMNLPYLLNGGRYESYYTEKDISFVLTEDHYLMENSDDICITENSIPQYTRINCSSKEELIDAGVFNNDDIPEPFNAQVYIDDRKKVYGWFVVTNNGSTLYKAEAYSFQMRQDLIKSVMIFFDPKTVMIWDESDRRVFAKHGFKNIKYTTGANVMVREEAILTEGIGQTKLNIEIALWKAQINITETILNNFHDENWMKHMYKKLKRMLNKTPLPGYADDLDDSLDSIKNKLNNQKATLAFYTELGAMELKESLDISDIITEYITWVEKLSCPKALKIKILNEVISAYKLSIRECEYNLARYRALDDSKKRLDNGLALIGKLTSAFSFITEGPLSIIKGMVLKSILPKTRKKSVLSEEELEAKIKLYTSIVEVLEDKKEEIGSLKESVISEASIIEGSNIVVPSDIIALNKELNKYDYGVLINGKVETDMNNINFGQDCRTISVSDFAKYKAGVCWDYVNYEAKWFKSHGYEYQAYYLELDDNNRMLAHTFILFKVPNSDKVYHFESCWFKYRGIEAFNTESEALMTITNRHRKNNGNFPASMYMYDTAGLDKNLTVREFMKKAKQKEIFREGVSSYRMSSLTEDTSMTDKYLYDGGTNITFLEGNDEILTESPDYNAELRKILYAERIKNNKEILNLYDQVKADCPFIKYTYIDYARYAEKNLFIDWSYYTQAFFKNNIRKYDKAVDLFVEFSNRFIDDTRLEPLGYNQKVILVPVDDWLFDSSREMWDYKQNLNPISIIYRLLFRDPTKLQTEWGGHTFLFTGKHGYFKMNFSMFERKNLGLFLQNIKTLINDGIITDDPNEPTNSIGGIVNKVVDALENKSTIQINNLTGATSTTPEELMDKLNNPNIISSDHTDTDEEKLVAAITKAAETSTTPDEVMDKIDNDEHIKQIIIDLKNTNPNGVSIDPTRAARMRKLDDSFSKKQIAGKTVRELLNNDNDMPLEETTLPIDSINDEWKHMTFMNHGKSYDLNSDIISCLYHFANTTEPFGIRDISQENTSTSEDWVSTWTVQCEDARGKRFTLKFDIPELKNNRFMHLRGNDKTINGQLMNLPIIKTDRDTCQMTSNYNKIFFTGYGSSVGKSYVVADRIIKTLNKMEKNPDMEIMYGDNSLICSKYELPSDYIDIASSISKITYYNRHIETKYTHFFNQDEFLEKYGNKVKEEEGFAIGIMESDSIKGEAIIYAKIDIPVSYFIYEILSTNETFADVYNTTNLSVRYTYSKASILNTDIPVAVIIGYYIGLIAMLDRAEIKYTISSSRPKYNKNRQDLIKLSDAFIVYDLDYNSSMILNGLKECDLVSYSLTEVNNKKMWVECLDNFGGRLKADGLDMFLDLMMDPITKVVCKKYQLPTEFIDALLYSNMLLSDNKYNQHTNVNGNRYRTLEVIAGYTYKALCNSYTQYRRDLRSGRDAKMTMKQTAVLDMLFADSTFSDLSALSDLLELETSNSTSWKGLSGMNSERAFGLDKRTYDASMINVLALSTGFAGNAGVNRQSTIDMSIDSARGYIKNTSDDSMSITKTFCMAEALTPMGTTSDDPFRSAMTFVQTTKHNMRVRNGDPLLITNGADEALPYLTSNTFTHKAKEAGKVKIKTDDYMVLEYMNKTTEVVDLRERILKNSDGGMYIAVQLETDLKEGNMFSEMEIVAVDKSSYTGGVGPNNGLAYNIGTFVKFAIINSDEGFEDSCIETEWMAKAMSSVVVINKEYTIPKDTNVHFIAKKGQSIQEGDPLLIFQNSFDEEDANMLIKTLSDEDGSDIVEELGRIPITSKVTGVIKDIKITRTVEKEELSPSLLKVVNAYEKDIKSFTKILDQYDKKQARTSDATYKLSTTGRLKNAKDSVRIEFSIAYDDDFSVGDKTVLYSALKGVSKGIIPAGDESYSEFRPDEKIHYIQSTNGDMKRMVGSIIKTGALNKVMVELHRKSCDIMGIKWKYFDEY